VPEIRTGNLWAKADRDYGFLGNLQDWKEKRYSSILYVREKTHKEAMKKREKVSAFSRTLAHHQGVHDQ
jgi:hypothetical protein